MSEEIDLLLLEAEEKMDKALAKAREDFASVRTGRVTASAFVKIFVDYYDTMTALPQLATIATPEARMAVITPFDKSSLGAIERALRDSDLGVNPSNDGTIIRVVFPDLTQERRKELVKVVRTKAEDAKISMRAIRRTTKEGIDKLVKDGDAGEDDGRRGEKELEDLTGKHVAQVDEVLKSKESELLTV
jgi:ribosome recycling factor